MADSCHFLSSGVLEILVVKPASPKNKREATTSKVGSKDTQTAAALESQQARAREGLNTPVRLLRPVARRSPWTLGYCSLSP